MNKIETTIVLIWFVWVIGWIVSFICWSFWGKRIFPNMGKMLGEHEYIINIFTWSFWWVFTTPIAICFYFLNVFKDKKWNFSKK